jgi:hypothetical protein
MGENVRLYPHTRTWYSCTVMTVVIYDRGTVLYNLRYHFNAFGMNERFWMGTPSNVPRHNTLRNMFMLQLHRY